MLTTVKYILYFVLAFLLQTTWLHHFELLQVHPNLIVLVLVYVGLASGHVQATVLGFCVGFLQDTYSPADLGLNALANSVAGFAVGLSRTGIMADTIQVQLLLVFAAVLLHDLIFYTGHSGIAMGDVPFYWLRYGLARAAYTVLITAVVGAVVHARRRFLPV